MSHAHFQWIILVWFSNWAESAFFTSPMDRQPHILSIGVHRDEKSLSTYSMLLFSNYKLGIDENAQMYGTCSKLIQCGVMINANEPWLQKKKNVFFPLCVVFTQSKNIRFPMILLLFFFLSTSPNAARLFCRCALNFSFFFVSCFFPLLFLLCSACVVRSESWPRFTSERWRISDIFSWNKPSHRTPSHFGTSNNQWMFASFI